MKPKHAQRTHCLRVYCTETEADEIARMSADFDHEGTVSSEILSHVQLALRKWRQERSIEQLNLFN